MAHLTHDPALPQYGHAMAQGLHILQFVGNQQDSFSLGGQLSECLKQCLPLKAGNPGGWFVQNQYLDPKCQKPDNFELLTLPNSEGPDFCIRVKVKTEIPGRTFELSAMGCLLKGNSMQPAHHVVFKDRERREVEGILIEHPDAESGGLGCPFIFHGSAFQEDAPIGLVHITRQYFHQGAFTGTVFSQDPLNRPRSDLHTDPVVGVYFSVVFMDISECDPHGPFSGNMFCSNSLSLALSDHPLQKLFHIPDLLIAGHFTGFEEGSPILIIKGTLEKLHLTCGKVFDETI